MTSETTHMVDQNAGKESAPGPPRITPKATFDTLLKETLRDTATQIPSQEDTGTALRNPQTTLQELLNVHDELRIWLDHTGFFDLEHRKRVLDGVRELKGLEAERAKVLHKIQSSKPVDSIVPESSAPSGRAPAPKRPPFVRDASYGPRSPPREPSSHTRSRSGGMMPLGREMGQLAARPLRMDTRYFLVKSSNTTNVYMSRRDGLWITQAKNGPLFTQAFRECKSVVLFFSINKSKAFQGYAKMTSPPDHGIPHPPWITNTTHDMHTTAPFRIDWINESETPFSQLGDLKNPYNEYNPVFVGRDGQEYSEDCGRRMMSVMDHVKAAQGLHSPVGNPSAHGGKPKSKMEIKRRFAATAASSSGSQPRGGGLGGSRWKSGAAPAVFLSLDPEQVNHGDEDLLLDYP